MSEAPDASYYGDRGSRRGGYANRPGYASAGAASGEADWDRADWDGDGSGDDADRDDAAPVRRFRRGPRSDPNEPGLRGWLAVLVLIVIAGIGGLIDQISGASIQGAFNWALVAASLIAILIVKRGQMFGVVIAPPLVYFFASAVKLYIASGGFKSRSALIDSATNWLVYGFPAIAGATAVVLLIAGIRLIIRK